VSSTSGTGRRWAVIAGGGTAGHVLPAIAIGHELVRRGLDPSQVMYLGSERGIEARLVPEAGFPVRLLPGRGIERKVSMQNVWSMIGLLRAGVSAVFELMRNRPAVVVSVGGYASSPGTLAAVLLRIPLVVVEQNARAGAANRLAAKFAKASAVAFDNTGLPRAEMTGNPVRPELLDLARVDPDVRRCAARDQLGIAQDLKLIAIFGGSLGATRINDAAVALVERWTARSDVFVYHITGERDYDNVRQKMVAQPLSTYRLVEYENRMDLVYSAADVCVCRAGASSIADLAIMGMPAVLVPLPSAAENHQTINAEGVVKAGGAVLVPDRDFSVERLEAELEVILQSDERRRTMRLGQLERARPNAAAAIVDLLVEHARKPMS
jgi:UDP-N-acetylglucosamine--N-acetylmuramyl-(pentapeptide) pyrophosphoryl-undecaprenol N-acetylglucosamine transferase